MRPGRSVDPGAMLVVIYLALVMLFLLFCWLQPAGAALPDDTGVPDPVGRGTLLLSSAGSDRHTAMPMLRMDVEINITGIVARTMVRQKFYNPGNRWEEALYVFPLPSGSSVDHLRMRVGERVIVGEIRPRQEARQAYEAARETGRQASLLSQQRPNVFTTSVANIGPGETVSVEIGYQQIVEHRGNVFSLRFPMVVGPRYMPHPEGDVPRGRPLLQAAVTAPGEAPLNPVRLRVNLAAGFALARLESLYHGIVSQARGEVMEIRFTGEVKADRDFVLEWEPGDTRLPAAALFREQQDDETWLLLMVTPPRRSRQEPLARETVFVLDISGSMAGASIRQAKKALRLALAQLRPRDRFNIITFNDNASSLFGAARPGTPENLQRAGRFIGALVAKGGTEIRPAIELALDGRRRHNRLRQVVLLTDACVGNEEELFSLISKRLGDSRLFSVGIGSAPNDYFLTRAAAMGRGSHTWIGSTAEVAARMQELFTMLSQPAVTDLVLSGRGIVEVLPASLPDLYYGQSLTVLVRGRREIRDLRLSGILPDRTPWQVELDSTRFGDRSGIRLLMAREKIRALMDSLTAGADPGRVRQQVTRLALDNHLVSRYTSMVAVDASPARPQGSELRSHRLKVNLPAGWRYREVFAGGTGTATSAPLLLVSGLLLLAGAGVLTWYGRQGGRRR